MGSKTGSGVKQFVAPAAGSVCFAGIICAVLIALAVPAAAFADEVLAVDSSGRSELVDTDNPGRFATPAAPPAVAKAGGIQFNVWYQEVDENTNTGFDDPSMGATRRAVVNDVLDYLGSVLNESGVCDINFEIPDVPEGALAYAGTFFSGLSLPFSNGYAFEHITTGVDPRGDMIDIYVGVGWNWPWYLGTGTPAISQLDLRTVLLHEITHGLGIMSLSKSTGESYYTPNARFTVWDSLLVTGNGHDLWNDSGTFVGSPGYLTGGDGGLRFTGPVATGIYGSTPPVYAPGTWAEGSSVSHFDISSAVMYPSVTYGATKRAYLDFEIAALGDIGYDVPITLDLTFVTQPTGGWFVIGDRLELGVAVQYGYGEYNYQWKKGTEELSGETQSTFVIESLVLEDAGNYSCVVTDDMGPHQSAYAQVKVSDPADLPAAGMIGLAILAAVCLVAGAFIIFKRA